MSKLKALRTLGPVLLLGAALGASCGGGGDDSNGDGVVDESAAPTSNGLFTYVPREAGAAPGYYLEATVGADVFVSDEVEVVLVEEDDYRRQIEQVRREGAGQAGLRTGAATATQTAREPFGDVDFGAASASDLRPRSAASIVADFSSEPRFQRRGGLQPAQSLIDRDGDGVPEDDSLSACTGGVTAGCSDNCPFIANADQADEDLDRVGDACEDDPDGDGILSDGDGSGTEGDGPCESTVVESCDDNCPNAANPRQWDEDGDGIGDACDTDRDGNGVADLDEGLMDHDGDGVPTADEGDVDSDGDGVPDYLDPDDDGDGIPTQVENDGDPDRDTDEDGEPDSRDDDADGDGVPDEAEGQRDTDGDGDPDSRDDDDDGDGVPTEDELDRSDWDSDGDGIPDFLDENDEDGCDARKIGALYYDMPTFNGWTTWASWTGSVQTPFKPCANDPDSDCNVQDYTWASHIGEDGIYFSLQYSEGVALTLDFAGIASVNSIGFMRSPEADPSSISAATMSDGRNLGLSWEPVPFMSVGFGLLEKKTPGANGPGFPELADFFQFDTGVGISFGFGLFGFSIFPDFFPTITITDGGITIMKGTGLEEAPAFLLVSGVQDRCPGAPSSPARATAQAQQTASPALSGLAATVRAGASSPATGAVDSNRTELWSAMQPLTDLLSAPMGNGSAQFVAAPSAADWLNEFVSQEDAGSCTDCANASIAGLVARTRDALSAADGSANDLAASMREEVGLAQANWPERERMNSLVAQAAAGSVNAVTALAFDVAAVRRGDAFRFASDQVVELSGEVGEPVAFVITAEEISDLIGYPGADIEGATVCVENNPQIDRICGAIEDGTLEGTFTPSGTEDIVLPVDVNLTTAAGRFDDWAVEDWVVRPATRLFRVTPGAVDKVALAAPSEMVSGGVATFGGLLISDDGMVVAAEAEWTLYDGTGAPVATATSSDGTVSFQLQPTALSPEITNVDVRMVSVGDDDVPGYVATGMGFSGQAKVTIDGHSVEERGYIYSGDSRALGIAVIDGAEELNSGTHTLRIENPGGAVSAYEFTVP